MFRDADGGWDLVDWKTGRRPSAAQLKVKAARRLPPGLGPAKRVPLEDVRAMFYYVADNQVVRPHDLGSADKLEEIVRLRWGGHRRRGESRRNSRPSERPAGRNLPAGMLRPERAVSRGPSGT